MIIEYRIEPGGAGVYVKNQTYSLYMFDSFPECKGDLQIMDKLEHFYMNLEQNNRGIEANNGDYGYFVTIEELLKNGGADEFFRKVRKSDKKVSRAVYQGLEYDKSDRAYYADCYTDYSHHSGALKKTDIVFIGFTF